MRRHSKGQVMVWIALALPILVGVIALGTDVGVLYWNSIQLQKAADAGVLAGANFLPDDPTNAIATAKAYAQQDGVKAAEITSTTVAGDDLSMTMQIQRTVPYSFARVLGLTNGTITVSAGAAPQPPTSTVGASTPAQVVNGDNNGNNGSQCSSTGYCQLIPIGLDTNTVYSDGIQIVLQQGQLGPGNWDLLALGGVGGNNLRTNIANGYSGPVSVNDLLTTEPGKKVGPVDQGFQDRLTAAAAQTGSLADGTACSSGTYDDHCGADPRVMMFPVVDWEHPHGRTTVPCTGFASVWLDSYSGGQVTVHFISQVAANSFGNSSVAAFGARGIPHLLQ